MRCYLAFRPRQQLISELPKVQSEAKCEAIDMKIPFYSHANRTHYHMKVFAVSLVLKVKDFETRK